METPREARLCLCGCGLRACTRYRQGHNGRIDGWLRKVERGEMTQEEFAAKGVVAMAYTHVLADEALIVAYQAEARRTEEILREKAAETRALWQRLLLVAGDGTGKVDS